MPLTKLNMAGQEPIAPIMGLVGWQWVYVLWGIPAILLSAVVLFHLTDKPRQARIGRC